MKVRAFAGLTVALVFACIPLRAHAQTAAGGMGSAAMGAAKQAGENAAAGQMVQNMGSAMMASPSATASPAGAPAMGGAPSMPSMPGAPSVPGEPSVPSVPSAPSMPSAPSVPSVPSVPSMPVAPPAGGY